MRRTNHLLPALGALGACLAWAPAARAQLCDPTQETCAQNPPSVSISPVSQQTDKTELTVRVTWSDSDGLTGSKRRIVVNQAAVAWAETSTATSSYAEGAVPTRSNTAGAPTVVIAEITDAQGHFDADTAVYTYTAPPAPPPPPAVGVRSPLVISLDPHHNGLRSVATGSGSLSYGMPAYTSMDQARSYGAVYLSGQAYPQGFVQVDVTDPNANPAPMYSVKVLNDLDAAMTLQNGQQEMYFSRLPAGAARVAAQWDMRSLPTGAYNYRVVVTGHWPGASSQPAIATVRVLNINESDSPFGRGWSMPGWHRIFDQGDGVMITHGDGSAVFFEKPATCTGVPCTYRSPAGDLSKLTKLDSERYQRVYTDGTKATYRWGAIHTVVDRFGNTTAYDLGLVNARNYPSGITDPTGQRVRFNTTGGTHRIGQMVDPGGRITSISYDAAGNVSAVAAPNNSYQFRDAAYNSSGLLTSWKDTRGGTWNLEYGNGHLLSVQAPAATANGARALTVFQPLQVAALRLTGSAASPAPGLSPDSVLIRITDPGNHTTVARMDRFGNVNWTRSPTGVVREALSHPVTGQTYIEKADGHETQYGYDAETGNLHTVWRDGQVVYSAKYAEYGQPRSVTQGGRTTWYSYNPANVLVRSWTGGENDTDSLSKATAYTFDSRGRPTKVVTPDGLISETYYQPTGSMNVDHTRAWKRVGERTMWVHTYYGYDGFGRFWWSESPDGVTKMEYDRVNRPTAATNPETGITRYGYTGPDLTSVTDPTGKVYRWSYDALGRQLTETDPQGRTRRMTYNADGMADTVIDRRGKRVAVVYDSEHRLSQRTADGKTTTFSYVAGPPRRVVAVSEFSTDTLQDVSLTDEGWMNRSVHVLGGRRYDVRNYSDAATGMPSKLTLTAFADGAQAWQHTASHTQVFTPSNRAYGFQSGTGNFAGKSVTMSYYQAGTLAQTAYPNGITRYHAYDDHRRPLGLSFSSKPLTDFMGAEYKYDFGSRLAGRWAMPGDTALLYSYDPVGRLTGRSVARYSIVPHAGCDMSQSSTCGRDTVTTTVRSESFTYDKVGNRTDRSPTLAPSSNRYTTFDGWTLGYDNEGNLTSKSKPGKPTQTFTWNALGQLASVTTNGQTTLYGYNGFGTRIRRHNVNTGNVVWYLYDRGNLLMELDGAGAIYRSYSHGAGIDNPLSVTVGDPSSGPTYYYVAEEPGHVRALMNSSGGFANKYVYGAFGERLDGTSEGVQQPLQFMGRERDDLTGIYYVRARWYDADLGRFVSEDPIGLSGGINTYAYANNDPINLRDPSGLRPDCPDGQRPGRLLNGTMDCVLEDLLVNVFDWKRYLREHDSGDHTRLRPASTAYDPFGGLSGACSRDPNSVLCERATAIANAAARNLREQAFEGYQPPLGALCHDAITERLEGTRVDAGTAAVRAGLAQNVGSSFFGTLFETIITGRANPVGFTTSVVLVGGKDYVVAEEALRQDRWRAAAQACSGYR
jgi:RHS repeat-associated protein